MEKERYAFVAEWYDALAGIVRRYNFLFYPGDNSVEMIDLKTRRMFLKRTKEEGVKAAQCYIGSLLNLHGRQLKLVEYGDNHTKTALTVTNEKTLALIKPDAMPKMPLLLEVACDQGFQVCQAKMVSLSRSEAEEFYQEHQGKPFFRNLVTFMTEGPILAVTLMADDAISKWRKMLGPTNSGEARSTAPSSIRARFGTDQTRNACHGSDSAESAKREVDFFFGKQRVFKSSADIDNCTLCIIKPHAVMRGMVGKIIRSIVEGGFEITGMQIFYLDKTNAEEFLEVYKGVVAEYLDMVTEFCAGPCVALALTHSREEAVPEFRKFAGPPDPEIARHLRPNTLRAKYGYTKVKNAIHCTDLPDDGALEVEYFFKILQRSSL